MHQRRRLERVPRSLLRHPLCCELAQLVIHKWQQRFRGFGVAAVDRGQNACDVAHKYTLPGRQNDQLAAARE
jgi:hypothetical protein